MLLLAVAASALMSGLLWDLMLEKMLELLSVQMLGPLSVLVWGPLEPGSEPLSELPSVRTWELLLVLVWDL
jgi:hypothetical protein